MPAVLPGLRYDEARKRYFPISSQPNWQITQSIPTRSHQISETCGDNGSRQQHTPWRISQTRMISPSYTTVMRESHRNLCYHYAHTSLLKQETVPTFGEIRAVQLASVGARMSRFVGDNQGWIYSDKELQGLDRDDTHYWSADFNLQVPCPITSMSVSETHVLSTCLGPGKFSVQNLNTPERVFILNLKGVADIRASHMQGGEAVLGAKNKVVHIPDIDQSTSPRHIGTKSDVFAILQRNYLLYAGERNGSVERFDIRMSTHQGQKLFDSRFGLKARSSVLYLDILGEHELLLSHLDGSLASFDLRFFPTSSQSRPPLRTFAGHVNNHLHSLGIAVDPKQNFLFAAGQDCRIRGWSLRTGDPISPQRISNNQTNPFETVFPSPISALQVTNGSGPGGVSLWVAYERDLCRFHLGQHW